MREYRILPDAEMQAQREYVKKVNILNCGEKKYAVWSKNSYYLENEEFVKDKKFIYRQPYLLPFKS